MKTKTVKGKCIEYFETGCEGVYWAIYEDGKEGYDGLHLFSPRNIIRLQVWTLPDETLIFDGNPELVGPHLVHLLPEEKCKELLTQYRQWPSGKGGQFTLEGLWVHHLPGNFPLDLWAKLMLGKLEHRAEAILKLDDGRF